MANEPTSETCPACRYSRGVFQYEELCAYHLHEARQADAEWDLFAQVFRPDEPGEAPEETG